MNHNGSGYSDQIIDCIICYPIVMVTSHLTVTDSLALAIKLSDKILESIYIIICRVALHWHSCTNGIPIKIYLGNYGIFRCE